jgi:hypothetical protein
MEGMLSLPNPELRLLSWTSVLDLIAETETEPTASVVISIAMTIGAIVTAIEAKAVAT